MSLCVCVYLSTQDMEMAEANDTLTVLGTLMTINCTLQKIQKQSVSLLHLLSQFIFEIHSLTAGLPPGKHYSIADNHTKHLCESEIN